MTMAGFESYARGVRRHIETPSDILAGIISDNPKASESKIKKLMWQTVESDGEMLLSIFGFWFDRHYSRSADKRSRLPAKETKDEIKERKKAEARVFNTISRLSLLGMKLPNGKILGDCTGKELTKVKTKMDGFVSAILKRLEPNQIVRDVFNNDDLWKLYRSS